jgi:uncharacterized membrane protein
MTQRRTGYVIALVVAVVVLVGSVAGAAVWSSTPRAAAPDRQVTNPGGRGGLGPGDDQGSARGSGRGPGAMMWDDQGDTASISLSEARTIAQQWVDDHLAGARLDAGISTMRGYRFTATLNGTTAVLLVDESDGSVIAHLLTGTGATPSPAS